MLTKNSITLSILLVLGLLWGCSGTPQQQASPDPAAAPSGFPPVNAARDRINQAVQQEADSLKKVDQTETSLSGQ